MRVIVDAFGGDNAPSEIVKGAMNALLRDSELEILLVGKEQETLAAVKEAVADSEIKYIDNIITFGGAKSAASGRITVIGADDVIGCDESPTQAIRTKKNSSMVVGLNLLKNDPKNVAFVSAGSTGAILTGAYLIVKRIKGISRPAMAPILPTLKGGQVILCDCGANADCKAEHLVHFAVMADKYMTIMNGIENPRIGLLSNGSEEEKGNELTKAAHALLKTTEGINFIGNIEARDIISGDVDVVVCDGFSGNVALKASEGMANGIMKLLKNGIMNSGLKGKLGALFIKDVLRDIKHTMDYNENGGAMFIGVEKVVVKAHGSAKASSIANAIIQAKELAKKDVIGKIKESLGGVVLDEA